MSTDCLPYLIEAREDSTEHTPHGVRESSVNKKTLFPVPQHCLSPSRCLQTREIPYCLSQC